ncbi:MAG: SO2930 family diheme c-type cytochrome, partial [Myxococcota bacterium]
AGSCAGDDGRCIVIAPTENDHETILSALIEARPGDVLYLLAGTYDVRGQLTLDVDDVTIRGEGMDETILSFEGQDVGGEGLLVLEADNFRIEDLSLEDSQGDLLRVLGSDGLFVRRVRAEWTNGPDEANGAYGIYPIQCNNVVIEDSVAIGASDAGIYVGQSTNVIVRRNTAEFNVAGIEIENSTDADVYENLATNNTGGILVFNLPGPPVQDGRRTRVFYNEIFANNTPNFAAPGNTVSAVPDGTGVMLLANDEVEIFENDFRDNATFQVLSVSFDTAAALGGLAPPPSGFDPYSEGIYVHDNVYSGGGENPDPELAFLRGVVPHLVPEVEPPFNEPNFSDITIDGDIDPAKFVDDVLPDEYRHCIDEDGATFTDLDFAPAIGHVFTSPSDDVEPYRCALASLGEVSIPGADDSDPGPEPDDRTPIASPEADSDSMETRCSTTTGSAVDFSSDDPACSLLSSYRFYDGDLAELTPNEGVVPYGLNTELFSDYSTKKRFVYMPEESAAQYSENESFQFPVGTVLIKNFTYPFDLNQPDGGRRIIETRLLVHRADRWVGMAYVWNDAQTEAVLRVTGATTLAEWQHTDGSSREANYHVPDANQCKSCHNEYDGITGPLGPKARNLNRDFTYEDGVENQLDRWTRLGLLDGAPSASSAPRAAKFDDPSTGDLEARARAYLDVNCGNCHNPSGIARPSGLNLTVHETDPTALGICKSPIAAGQGSGGFDYDIEPGLPEESILTYRMASTEVGIAMPELGRQTVHDEALEVVSDWIGGLAGTCE